MKSAALVGGLVAGGVLGFAAAKLMGRGATVLNPSSSASGGPLFELGGKSFSDADLPGDVKVQLYDIASESFERQQQLLTQFALRVHLAKKKGGQTSTTDLPPMDQLLAVGDPSDEEVKKLWESNKERLPPNTTYEQIKPEIVKYLKNQKVSEASRAEEQTFRTSGEFKLLAGAPLAPEINFDLSTFPARGTSATATLVEIADYLCPHCQMVQPEVETLLKEMGDKMRFVAVPFSLKPDGLSGNLAQGAFCARQQGDELFWKYHMTAFSMARSKGWKATEPSAKEPVLEVAKDAGLDTAKVETCLASPEADAYLKNTVKKLHDAGVTQTPTFVVNGRLAHPKAGKTLKSLFEGALDASSH